MIRIKPLLLMHLCMLLILLASCGKQKANKLLIFSDGANPVAQEAQKILLLNTASEEIEADTTSHSAFLTEDSLKHYGAIVFLYTSQDAFDVKQQNDIERFVQAGGAIVGIHAQGSTPYQWPWFNKLLGGKITTYNDTVIQDYTFSTEADHVSTNELDESWKQRDRLLTLEETADNVHVVTTSNDKPVSWYNEYDGGKLFYTLGGGTVESYSNENFQKLLMGGIKYALKGNALNYEKARTPRLPEENRFLQVVLDTYLDEPIEMEILSDGKVLFIERHGNVKLYDPTSKQSKIIAKLNVQLEGNYEDGLLGLELDPAFATNNYIYLYYSPLGGKPVQNLSRFKMVDDSLILNSEKIILEVPVQRETCCHSAGNVYFGNDGHLYLSTGDNTSSKESDGYTPIDERPGRGPFDAQKSSGNTHDLRGKILRIHVEEDGSYTIPNGNLFPKDGSKGRPEIYIMGARNPYRVTLDKRGFLYWGDVGPDGGQDSERGPRSYDEWNQARKPGNYGWPYFVGDSKAYADFDFATNTIGPKFNPDKPINESPYNYGSKELPPANKAMIWYSYNGSNEFPMLGTGSRSAMAGPFYYYQDYKNSEVKFPEYYNEKMFIFEWARSWIKVLSFNKEGDLQQIESFLPGYAFYHPIDIKFGPDGAMYVLQYGANYFARNPDAQLVRIEYTEGNRKPVAQIHTEKAVGAAPLTVELSAENSFDYDAGATLQYNWTSGNGETSKGEKVTFTYPKPGLYTVTLTVTDAEGSNATATTQVKVGNETPEVNITIMGNSSFYFDNNTISYKVDASDKEDGKLNSGIDPAAVKFMIEYLPEGKDLALLNIAATEGIAAQYVKGKTLIDASDCKSCHALDKKSIGPSWMDVSARYKNNQSASPMLAKKIIAGGNGNWGKTMMAAHPQLSEEVSKQMVDYILSLSSAQSSLPLVGTYKTTEHIGKGEDGSYIITASYTDKGSEVTGKLSGREMITLRNPKVQAEDYDGFSNIGQQRPVGKNIVYVSDIKDGSYIAFKNIDLSGIGSLLFTIEGGTGRIEARSGSVDGKLLGTATITKKTSDKNSNWSKVSMPLSNPNGTHDLYFVFRNEESKSASFLNVDYIEFRRR